VHNWRAVGPCVSRICKTDHNFGTLGEPLDGIVREQAKCMAAGEDLKRGVQLINGIHVNSERDHSCDNFNRRLHVRLAALDRPGIETFSLDPVPYGDHSILMPA